MLLVFQKKDNLSKVCFSRIDKYTYGYYAVYTMIRLKQKNFRVPLSLSKVIYVAITLVLIAAVTYGNLRPAPNIRSLRDAQRESDVNRILQAIYSYKDDNNGEFPPGMARGMAEMQIGEASLGCATSNGRCSIEIPACLNLAKSLAMYLKNVPTDPLGGTASITNYSVNINPQGIVTVKACGTEGTTDISQSR